MILIVDNFDSFTWNLIDYIEQAGVQTQLVRNNLPPANSFSERIKGVVLSPGPGKPDEAGFLMEYIRYYEKKVPILGICLGHQAIAQFYGASIGKAPEPCHGKITKAQPDPNHYLFRGVPSEFDIVRYHSLIVKDITDSLAIICQSEKLTMGIAHRDLPICGIQFHPEAYLTRHGHIIIQNWISFCQSIDVE